MAPLGGLTRLARHVTVQRVGHVTWCTLEKLKQEKQKSRKREMDSEIVLG